MSRTREPRRPAYKILHNLKAARFAPLQPAECRVAPARRLATAPGAGGQHHQGKPRVDGGGTAQTAVCLADEPRPSASSTTPIEEGYWRSRQPSRSISCRGVSTGQNDVRIVEIAATADDGVDRLGDASACQVVILRIADDDRRLRRILDQL